MSATQRYVGVVLAVLISSATQVWAQAQPSFQGLGQLSGYTNSWVLGISDDGSTVVGAVAAGTWIGRAQAFRWTAADGMVILAQPSGTLGTRAWGASQDGSVIAGDGNYGTKWTSSGTVATESQSMMYARAVSADGSVVVGADALHPCLWTQAGVTPLSTFYNGWANDVSADGSVIVGEGVSGHGEAFRWTQAQGIIPMGFLHSGDTRSYASKVSADGSTVVGAGGVFNAQATTGGPTEAFRWTAAEGMVALGDLAGGIVNSDVYGVSADGSIIVGVGTTDAGPEAFIWTQAWGMRDLRGVLVNGYGLDLTGWNLGQVMDISADGRTITGYGTHNGQSEAWIATTPEPATLPFLALSALALLTRRRIYMAGPNPA